MKTSKEFYTELGVKGLAERKPDKYTRRELVYLKRILNKKQKILDLGCGYGRFTIPLTRFGYNIEGIDITPSLIKEARKKAKKEKIKIKFKIGDIRNLPYKDESFDSIICMWSVFTELYKKSWRLKAIKEMLRVLVDGGFALIELPLPFKKSLMKSDDSRILRKGNIVVGKIAGIEAMPSFMHNKKTLISLMKRAKIEKYKVYISKFGGRDRLFSRFWKVGKK